MSDVLKAKKLFEEGISQFNLNKFNLAKKYFEDALKFAPDRISILENLALVNFKIQDYQKSKILLNQIDKLNKETEKSFKMMVNVLLKMGDIDELKTYIEIKLKKIKIGDKYKILKDLVYPNFFENEESIIESRKQFLLGIKNLEKTENIQLDINKDLIDSPVFNLSYDQFENLEINKKIVKLFKKFYPELNKIVPQKKINTKKIQIGFASEYFTAHTIGKLYQGMIFKLDKKKFDIHIFHSQKTQPSEFNSKFYTAETLGNIKNYVLPSIFDDKVELIKNCNLDILFFPEIGMSTEFYFLSYIRFCKNQITSWGHPMTTGNENIDFFLSSKLLETPESQKKYSEKLILSDYLPMYFYRPHISKTLIDDELKKQNIYLCPQTLIKIHPHFDVILKKILQNDKKAKITFIKDKENILAKKLLIRFKKNISNNLDRIIFLDQMKIEDYINTCGRASVLLDTLYFGAGNSFHESMYYGTPTVSMPTDNIKSRIVLGSYNQMKIDNPPIVKNIDDYVESAIRIANKDNNSLLELKKFYADSANKRLYENKNFIIELENIFIDMSMN